MKLAPVLLILLLAGCDGLPAWGGRLPVLGGETGPWAAPAPSVPRAVRPVVIETTDGRRCNAVRLDDHTLATAAHCVSGAQQVGLIEEGLSRGTTDILLHPAHGMGPAAQGAARDLAKLRLPAQAPTGARVVPAPLVPGPVDILLRSQAGGVEAIPCGFVGRGNGMAELSCTVSLGWSGAPVVQQGALVGILSGRGRVGSADIAQIAEATGLNSF